MYDAGSSMGGPAFVFGKDPKNTNMNTLSPGPGAYDAKDGITRNQMSSAKIGTSQRKTESLLMGGGLN